MPKTPINSKNIDSKNSSLREPTRIAVIDTSAEDLESPFSTQFESTFHGPACVLPDHYFTSRPDWSDDRPKRTVLSVSKPGQEKLVMRVCT